MTAMRSLANVSQIHAVTDVGEAPTPCGAIVFWLPRGATATHDAMVDAIVAEGCAIRAPRPTSRKVALARACEVTARAHGLAVSSLQRDRGGKVKATKGRARGTDGWVLSYPLALTSAGAWGTLEGSVVLRAHDDTTRGYEGPADLCDELRTEFQRQLDQLAGDDLSKWLCEAAQALGGLSLNGGGGYYLPPSAMSEWVKVRAAMGRAAPVFAIAPGIPCGSGSAMVESIMISVEENATKRIAAIAETIATPGKGALALATVETKLSEALATLDRFEGLLGRKLPAVVAQAEEARSALAIAMLAATAEDDASARLP
jgi:hypothetical protein